MSHIRWRPPALITTSCSQADMRKCPAPRGNSEGISKGAGDCSHLAQGNPVSSFVKRRDGEGGHSSSHSFLHSCIHSLPCLHPNLSFTAPSVCAVIQLPTYPFILSFTHHSPSTCYALGYSVGLQVAALHPSRELRFLVRGYFLLLTTSAA